jgi:hypothetical protein
MLLLGHAHVSTSQKYKRPHLEQVNAHARDHQARRRDPDAASRSGPVLGYETSDLDVLFGWRDADGGR